MLATLEDGTTASRIQRDDDHRMILAKMISNGFCSNILQQDAWSGPFFSLRIYRELQPFMISEEGRATHNITVMLKRGSFCLLLIFEKIFEEIKP